MRFERKLGESVGCSYKVFYFFKALLPGSFPVTEQVFVLIAIYPHTGRHLEVLRLSTLGCNALALCLL